jgi:hypothetical protein
MSSDFNTHILDEVAHRPWPMPERSWAMTQTWHDLLFAHWPVDADAVARKIPPHFELDLFGGQAWVGIVPFHMTNVAPRAVPALPWLSAFPELNVRTYVRAGDKPGVYFFSLDAGSMVAVQAARLLLNLPYFEAEMQVAVTGDRVGYSSRRKGHASAEFGATYHPNGAPFEAPPGTIEYFLTERYCLYHVDHGGHPYRLEIHHPPWPLQSARAEITRNTMADVHGLSLPSVPPLLHFSRRQDMVGWLPERL